MFAVIAWYKIGTAFPEDYMRPSTFNTDSVINSLPGIFYMFDSSGNFITWNKNFEAVSGFSAAEIALMKPYDFFEGEERDYIAEKIKTVFEEGSATADAHFVTKFKKRIPYHFTGVLTIVDDEPCLIGMGIDISERKKAETALLESEQRYRQIAETAQEGIILVDENNVVIFVNDRLSEILSYPKELMMGKPLASLMRKNEWKTAKENPGSK